MDFGGIDAVSLSGSAFASAATLYFWMIRANRERPAVRVYLDGSGRTNRWLGEDIEFEGTPEIVATRYKIAARLPMVLINESMRQNVALSADVSIQRADGSWDPCKVTWEDGTFPRDLPSESTVRLDVRVVTHREFEREPDGDSLEAILGELSRPIRFRIALKTISGLRRPMEVSFPQLDEQIRELTQSSKEAAPILSPQPPSGLRMRRDDEQSVQVRVIHGAGASGQTIQQGATFRDNVGEEYRYDSHDETHVAITRIADNAPYRVPFLDEE